MKHLHLIIYVGILSLLFGSSMRLSAQAVGEWQVYPAYQNATQNVTDGTNVYSLMDGNLLRYDTEDTSVKLYDYLNDLNDVQISYIAYCKAAKRIVIAYKNANIDLIDADDNIINISSLKDKALSNKTITSIYIDAEKAYFTTGFGFVVVDVKEGTVLDTYQLDMALQGVLLQNGNIYVATSNKVYKASTSANWHETNVWSMTTEVSRSAVVVNHSADYNLAGGLYWHSDGLDGLNGYKKSDDGTYQKAVGPIQPNSPRRDLFYKMHYDTDGNGGYKLLVVGGSANYSGIYNKGTVMSYDGTTWTNFDESYWTTLPTTNHYNFTDITQDPNDPTHHYVGSFRTGMYEFKDAKFVKLYNWTNSPIKYIDTVKVKNPSLNYVGLQNVAYDNDGTLWMCNQETGDTLIRYMTSAGKWGKLYFSEIKEATCTEGFLFTTTGVNFLISQRVDGRGFFGFTADGKKHRLAQTIKNEDNTTYSPDHFACMAEDLDGKVWCGTELGLFVIDDPSTFFDDSFTFDQVKISRDDGSGLADYLLNGVNITCIAVDGANRKWIGTENNGLYLISADGTQMIHHFLTSDTPLLSDNIQCLAIQPQTGLVMIGTDVGLCSYMSDAIPAEEELSKSNVIAYPNPVGPEYTSPIRIKGLTMNAEVKILSSAGQLVASGTSNGGMFTWDGCNKQGRRVSSGVYQVIANTEEGKNAVVCRIVVIK